MNKFLPVEGGHSLHLDEFKLMQDAYLEGFKALVYKLAPSGNIILDGVTVDQSGPNVVFTSGHIAMFGEIYKVEGAAFSKSTSSADVLYFKPTNKTIAPSPITYEDGTQQAVHIERKAILKYKDASDTDGVALSDMTTVGTVFEGSIIPWYPPTGKTVSDYFDANGIGFGVATGYALCDGRDGRLDLRGFYLAMTTDIPGAGLPGLRAELAGTTLAKGTYIGVHNVKLTQQNLPNYDMTNYIVDPGHYHGYYTILASGGGVGDGLASNHSHGNENVPNKNTATSKTNIKLTSGGSDVPHENRPGTFVIYYITRLR